MRMMRDVPLNPNDFLPHDGRTIQQSVNDPGETSRIRTPTLFVIAYPHWRASRYPRL